MSLQNRILFAISSFIEIHDRDPSCADIIAETGIKAGTFYSVLSDLIRCGLVYIDRPIVGVTAIGAAVLCAESDTDYRSYLFCISPAVRSADRQSNRGDEARDITAWRARPRGCPDSRDGERACDGRDCGVRGGVMLTRSRWRNGSKEPPQRLFTLSLRGIARGAGRLPPCGRRSGSARLGGDHTTWPARSAPF